METGTQVTRIVVGVDGSGPSLAALAWAARQAELTNSMLVALTSWHWPVSYGYAVPLAPGYDPAEEAGKMLEQATESARREHPKVEILASVVEGYAAKVLVDASKGAELLVVGSRGHGELAGLLVGSVSEHCVGHAHCPVLVMRS